MSMEIYRSGVALESVQVVYREHVQADTGHRIPDGLLVLNVFATMLLYNNGNKARLEVQLTVEEFNELERLTEKVKARAMKQLLEVNHG